MFVFTRDILQVAALNDKNNPSSTGSFFLISAGGVDSNGNVMNTVDLYNTTSRSFSSAPSMKIARARHTLTSVFNGSRTALAVGGLQVIPLFPFFSPIILSIFLSLLLSFFLPFFLSFCVSVCLSSLFFGFFIWSSRIIADILSRLKVTVIIC